MSPIDCRQVLKEIELYLDGELKSAVSVEIKAHLEGCGPCMDRAEFRRHLTELIVKKCGCEDIPPEVLERVRARLEASEAT